MNLCLASRLYADYFLQNCLYVIKSDSFNPQPPERFNKRSASKVAWNSSVGSFPAGSVHIHRACIGKILFVQIEVELVFEKQK